MISSDGWFPISDKISFLVFDFCFDFNDFLLFGFLTTDFWDKCKFSIYTMNLMRLIVHDNDMHYHKNSKIVMTDNIIAI